ncbi:hypothetical protein Patl1_31056 [Pistacia atlantica]|uniref:Uncharacterized protein n=1 Tax=Pistacia atlantica TaxID=434234 RepID=A0ACC1A9B7_9ROSI|nr:hypothetical protein Patl1_31056 [Pistacia atlantica]
MSINSLIVEVSKKECVLLLQHHQSSQITLLGSATSITRKRAKESTRTSIRVSPCNPYALSRTIKRNSPSSLPGQRAGETTADDEDDDNNNLLGASHISVSVI